MIVVSWNVAGRVRRLAEQAERVLGLDADLVCLQELTLATIPAWTESLGARGYRTAVARGAGQGPRPLAVLTAAKSAIAEVEVGGVPWPERVLAARVTGAGEVINVHSPISTKPGLVKVHTHEALYAHLARPGPRLRLLCGDLNTPRREHADGSIWTFARDSRGRLRPERGERWDRAELGLIQGLQDHGFRDAYRAVHGYQHRELSWEWPRWKGGYRLDHLMVSEAWQIESCSYLHDWRHAGLSDHSPLVAELRQGPAR